MNGERRRETFANCPRTGAKTRESTLTQNYSFQFQGKLCLVLSFAKKKKKQERQQIISFYNIALLDGCHPNEWK